MDQSELTKKVIMNEMERICKKKLFYLHELVQGSLSMDYDESVAFIKNVFDKFFDVKQ